MGRPILMRQIHLPSQTVTALFGESDQGKYRGTVAVDEQTDLLPPSSKPNFLTFYVSLLHQLFKMRSSDFLSAAVTLLVAASPAAAVSCSFHSFTTCEDGIVHWFDPDDGMICDPLDCGGGRAPVKTNVPGCAAYKGTLTRATSASYLSCFKKNSPATAPVATSTVVPVAVSSKPASAVTNASAPKPAETSKASVAATTSAPATGTDSATSMATTVAPSQSARNSTGDKTTSAPNSTSTGGAGKVMAGSVAIAIAAAAALL